MIQANAPVAGPAWHELNGEIDGLGESSLAETEVRGTKLIVAMRRGSLLAYPDACAACGRADRGR